MRARGVLGLLLLGALPALALEVPFLTGRVQDDASILGPAARERIEATLAALEGETGAQVAVLTIPSLEGDSLEDFSLRVAETWALGREGVDDGVLLLVARDDRKIRIEVGYGLEGTLTDAACRRVIDGLMTPRFREGDFDGGVEAAVTAIAGAIRGQEDAIPVAAPSPSSGGESGERIFFGFMLFLVLGPLLKNAARLKGIGGWILYFLFFPVFFFFTIDFGWRIAVTVLLVYAVGVALVRWLLPARWQLDELDLGSSGGGGSSSGGSSYGGGGGGFSGGGGSFGGGGSSGGW